MLFYSSSLKLVKTLRVYDLKPTTSCCLTEPKRVRGIGLSIKPYRNRFRARWPIICDQPRFEPYRHPLKTRGFPATNELKTNLSESSWHTETERTEGGRNPIKFDDAVLSGNQSEAPTNLMTGIGRSQAGQPGKGRSLWRNRKLLRSLPS
ncbi:hypothetical protein RRG08_024112 [Elysia crispata]|uniref:Uncharacterized protein n=1 Tax=Elysia crispata TaxID=231223 RepID=A0AAE1BC95_9GAST|nr:hypothetical protein RRG08_024112 [Elysia crispata]